MLEACRAMYAARADSPNSPGAGRLTASKDQLKTSLAKASSNCHTTSAICACSIAAASLSGSLLRFLATVFSSSRPPFLSRPADADNHRNDAIKTVSTHVGKQFGFILRHPL